MSEGVGPAAENPRSGGVIRNPRDFWGGVVLILIALFALWAGKDLPGMRGFAFGPGTAPRLFGWFLVGLGAAIVAVGVFTDGPKLERYAFRGPFFVTVGVLIFALTIRPLGLVIASFVSLIVMAAGTHEVRWIETVIWAAVLTLFCSLLFPYGLNLPLQLWPRF